MSDTNYKWNFPVCSETSNDVGFNEPMSENFKKYPYTSLVREAIQNSLDVHLDNDKPVEMGFTIKSINRNSYPNFFKIREHIDACLEYFKSYEKARNIYEPMLEYLDDIINNNHKLYYIQVSDYNTTGMTYVPQNNENAFYAFVRAAGVAFKSDSSSGGCFGFGKAAYFYLSKIRTLLVSTVDTQGNCFFEGVSSLCTHRLDDHKINNIGYYDCKEGYPVDNQEDILSRFSRKENGEVRCGTDINIMGIDIVDAKDNKNKCKYEYTQEDIYNEMKLAVLRNFWLAIFENRLVVTIGDLTISQDNILEVVEKTFPIYDDNKRNNNYNPRGYLEAVMFANIDKNHKVYEWNLNLRKPANNLFQSKEVNQKDFGRVKLYLFKCPQGNNKVLYMRQPRMLIERSSNNTATGFFGVFVCENGYSNTLLRYMENPAHNEWNAKNYATDNSEDKTAMSNLLEEFKQYVTDCLKDFFHINEKDYINIQGIDQYIYIPSELDEEDNNNEAPDSDSTGELKDEGASITTDISTPATITTATQNTGTVTVGKEDKAKEDKNGHLFSGKGNSPRKTPGHGMGIQATKRNSPNPSGKKGIFQNPAKVTFRAFAQTLGTRVHHKLVIHSLEDYKNCQIHVKVGGDQNTEIIDIVKTNNGQPSKNILAGVSLKKGRNLIDIVFSDNWQHAINLSVYED